MEEHDGETMASVLDGEFSEDALPLAGREGAILLKPFSDSLIVVFNKV